MSTKPEPRRRSALMWLLRVASVPLVLACLAGGALMIAGRSADAGERQQFFWDAGYHILVLGGALLVALLWGGVYLEVREASRGMPGLRVVAEPPLSAEAAARLRELKSSLSALGFRPNGWFSLDDFARTHVGAWRHESSSTFAFVLHYPNDGSFRLRFVRRFASGGVLVSSTRVTDLSYPPPQGMYVQVKKGASVDDLWAWHLDAEALFPDATASLPDGEAVRPRELFVAIAARWAGHRRRDRTWLLALEPVGECWRIFHLCGMPLSDQFEQGWTVPFWQ